MKKIGYLLISLIILSGFTTDKTLKIAKLKYGGGGDWYANRTALPNFVKFCNENLGTTFVLEEDIVEVGNPTLFAYPFVYMTGHGNVIFSDQEARNLRNYLAAGGFLLIDDNYGLEKFIRPQMKKVFPEHEFVELPFDHPIFHQKFDFNKGLPKVHEHDGERPQAFGLIHEGRLVALLTIESDLGNGWEDVGIYPDDSPETRLKALKMGANILQYVLMN
ncbi:MAG: hypothetical protein ACJAZ3_000884 [Sphingobacteriales bacterium]|jgi:hypothetical protein